VTTPCTECRTLLGGYVLHALDAREAEEVRLHLTACSACADEYAELRGIPAVLDVAGTVETSAEEPPPALEEAVLDRFAREHRGGPGGGRDGRRRTSLRDRLQGVSRRLARPLPAAFAAALAAAAVTAAVFVLAGGGAGGGEQYQASLAGSPAAPDATASADLRDDGAKVSAGTFRTDGSGSADVSLTTAAVPGEYHRLSVERKALEPVVGDGQAVMAGEIRYPHS
jgi:anti-sigma factor RsiW